MGKRKSSVTSSAQSKQLDGLSVDWELANTAASEWAQQYSFELVGGIVDSTQARLQREIAGFVESGESVIQLRDRMAPVFGEARAELIAVTETTRAFAEGNQAAWRESGVTEGNEWVTSNDELVCPLCGPLDGVIVPVGDEFPDGGGSGPPRHPRCRCGLSPVVIDPAIELVKLERAGEIALIERGSVDPLAGIRPPQGRAPRGSGTEYKLRRRMANRIETQMRYRELAQRQLNEFRGQTGHRLRWRIDVAKERVFQLNKGISAMTDIAANPAVDDWVFKSEIVDGIIEHIAAFRV